MKKTICLVIFMVLLSFCGVTAVGAPGDLIQTFENPPHHAGDAFFKVAAVGDNVIVGAWHADPCNIDDAGAAYLFDASTGNLLRTYVNQSPAQNDMFGVSVAGVGGYILIGAEGEDTGAPNAGAAYLYDASGNRLRTFQKPIRLTNNYFATTVAAFGDDVLVGTYHDDVGDGAVYLFDSSNGSVLCTYQKPTSGTGLFGRSITAVGDNVLIGASRHSASYRSSNVSMTGEAYLFDGLTGDPLLIFQNPTPEEHDMFGCSVAAVGNCIVIGSFAKEVYLFDASTGNQLPHSPITNPYPEDYAYFGLSVAAVGNNILVGASGANDVGAAYLFGIEGNLLLTLPNPTPENGDRFGGHVAAFGNSILVGDYMDHSNDNAGGAVYLFEGFPFGDFEPDGDVDLADFAVLVSAWLTDEEDGSWDSACDIYPDGFIDMLDFAVFAGNWRKGVP